MHDGLIRLVLWVVSRGLFKVRLIGKENVPMHGPALLASNHVTYLDGFLIWFFIPCPVRFIVWKPFFKLPVLGWALRFIEAIPVADSGPRSMRETLRLAHQQLVNGQVVCIFPEGSITRNGEMDTFRRGMEVIVKGLDVPIIPVYLDGLWGHLFSFEGGRAIWKWPKHLRHPGTISFGKPLPASSTPEEVRDAVVQLAAEAANGHADADQMDGSRQGARSET